MANKRINRYIGAIVLGAVLTAVPGCTDTWDDHYNSDGSVSGTTATLWDVLKDNSDYSRFTEILKNAKFYKDNTHPVSTYTYADVLASGQVNTIWAPDNNVLTESEYQKWMDMLTATDAEGNPDVTAGYNVQQQFIGNHISLWRHNISEPGIDTVKMINGKNLIFDKTAFTLQEVPLDATESGKTYNIPAVNGVVHFLKGIAPFHYNFYEYLKFRNPITKLGQYVVSKDTTYFSASSSIEGLPDENGNPTYVDSVYFTSNRLFEGTRYLPATGAENWQMYDQGFGARIQNEDSVFVMLLPTDAAWDAAYEMLKESHKYASVYEDKTKGDLNVPATQTIIKGLDADSLQRISIGMDLVSPLVFNIHKQPKIGSEKMWTLEDFIARKGDNGMPDVRDNYLLNTYGDTLRNVGAWDKTSLFDAEPVDMSNGIGYEVSSWNFPKEYYTPDVEVEVEGSGMFYNTQSTKFKIGTDSRYYSFSNETYSKITDIYGKVSRGNFYRFAAPGPTAAPKAEIKLFGNNPNAYVPNAQVMSGNYDIQIVVVPHWYIDIANAAMIDDDFFVKDTIVTYNEETGLNDSLFVPTSEINTDYVKSLADVNKYKFKVSVTYNEDKSKDKTLSLNSKGYDYDGLKVDTITVAEDFNFPVSYKNMRFSYPTIYIEGNTGKTDAKNGYIYDLVIDKIILKRKN